MDFFLIYMHWHCKRILLFPLLIAGSLINNIAAQDFHYLNYSTKEGLAGNTVYYMCQDIDGFMWFATEAGVSRFNGSTFKNYTSADGLSDNEILKVFPDSKGRVWIAPFKNKLCYYKDNKIFNSDNDDILRQIKLSSFVLNVEEDNAGNLVVYDRENLYLITAANKVVLLPGTGRTARRNYFHPGFKLQKNDSIFTYDLNKIVLRLVDASYNKKFLLSLDNDSAENQIFWKWPFIPINQTREHGRLRYISTSNGAYQVSKTQALVENYFMEGEKVIYSMADDEDNIWFSVPEKGVFKLASTAIRNYRPDKTKANVEIYSVANHGGQIVAGGSDCLLYFFSGNNKAVKKMDFTKYTAKAGNESVLHRAYCSKQLSSGELLIGFDAFLIKLWPSGKSQIKNLFPIKAIAEAGPETVVVATNKNVLRLRKKDLQVLDTLFNDRATAVCYSNNNFYIGTLSGVYKIDPQKKITWLGATEDLLDTHVSALETDFTGALWVATYNNGIVKVVKDKVVQQMTGSNYLSGDICRCLYIDSQFLWIGTNKGINKIGYTSDTISSVWYQQSQGLSSNMINAILIDDSLVYAGTPDGLVVFNKNFTPRNTRYRLKLLDVTIGNQPMPVKEHYTVGYKEQIKIEWSLISLRPNNTQTYVYRLKGYSDKWDSSNNSSITFSYLPPGDFNLEVSAIGKDHIVSNLVKLSFTVRTPFWKETWFFAMGLILFFGLGWSVIYTILKRKNKEEKRKRDIQLEILNLQQKALRAQMNPHFIFNCLNTVQDFILSREIEPANKFLSRLSLLIRQTLENSANNVISISNEINYLSTYLEIEQIRHEHRFSFTFAIDESVKKNIDAISIPTMIVQPFVENAVKHGISNNKLHHAVITVAVSGEGDNRVSFLIADNGIGINKSMEMKSRTGSHHSMGMKLINDRIKAITQITGKQILLSVADGATEKAPLNTGTRVHIIFEI